MVVSSRFSKRKGLLLFFLFGLSGLGICVFFVVVIFFTLFSGLVSNHSSPVQSEKLEVAHGFPSVGHQYLSLYKEAGEKYGVPWNILAAIHKIETDFGRDLSVSVVGAKGHTQFMDKTWIGWQYPGGTKWGDLQNKVDITNPELIRKYGGYGVDADGDGRADPYSPIDAIHSTANFLSHNHTPGTDWFQRGGAVWKYNHDYEHYVVKVEEYAERFAYPVMNRVRTSFLFPVPEGIITSHFGKRFHPLRKTWMNHQGIDIGRSAGSPILAAASGYVIASQDSVGYGWKIVIDHGDGLETLYAHMEPNDVRVIAGDKIDQGQVIALVGNHGWSTGPHLHFEIHKNGYSVDPEAFFEKTNPLNDERKSVDVPLESGSERK